MAPRRDEAAVAAVIFVVSAIWGGVFHAQYIRAGHHPFFYQSYFEPAVMVACGKGFLVSKAPPPPLRAFLMEQTDRFSCDELPRDLQIGTEGLYQRPWRYLMTAVGLAWKVLGISWSGLAPMVGLLFGTTTVLAYALCRLFAGRIAAAACAAALCVSTLQLTNLPNIRDYAKAPFTVALVAILIALAVRPWRRRDVLLLSLGYGLVMGIGYGFRTDLLVDIPPFLIVIALFLPGGVWRGLPVKAAAVGLFAAGFVAAAWPIITTIVSGGGCQWHVFLLGLTSPFNSALGVSGGAYGWGHLYKDEYLWATVASYAGRHRPDLGYIEYCSHEYDVASWDYLRQILTTFPADMLTRAYAAVLQVLDLPFLASDPPFSGHLVTFYRARALTLQTLRHSGPLLAAAFVLAISATGLRLALFATFVMLYFGGHPAIQFLPRHYFPFEFMTWAVLAFLVERSVRAAAAFARERQAGTGGRMRETIAAAARGNARRIVACAALVTMILVLPLLLLRWYQNGRVTRLLETYIASSSSPLALAQTAPGEFRTPAGHDVRLSPVEAIAAIGREKSRFVRAEIDAAGCARGTTVTFRYEPGYPATDFSRTVTLEPPLEGSGPTRLFEPVYDGFAGIDLSDPSPACVPRVSVLNSADTLPLLLSAQLPPGWASRPQYQQITRSR